MKEAPFFCESHNEYVVREKGREPQKVWCLLKITSYYGENWGEWIWEPIGVSGLPGLYRHGSRKMVSG